jgi:hypothetical protein
MAIRIGKCFFKTTNVFIGKNAFITYKLLYCKKCLYCEQIVFIVNKLSYVIVKNCIYCEQMPSLQADSYNIFITDTVHFKAFGILVIVLNLNEFAIIAR